LSSFDTARPNKARAVVIGSGPNGLTAAITLARGGYQVTVYERAAEIGGGVRSAELTLPGFVHDICSAAYPMAVSSPAFEQFPLAAHGLEWIHPEAPLAHPMDDGTAAMLERSVDATARNLGPDGEAWRGLMEPLAESWPRLRHDVLAPLHFPRYPLLMARFGLQAIRSARSLAESRFRGPRARALFAGIAAHAALPLEARLTAGVALALAVPGHAAGWPFARGGAQRIGDALAGYLRSLGGEILTRSPVTALPDAPIVMCDVTPRQFLRLAGDRLPKPFRNSLAGYRYGPGAFKMDWALNGPIPWTARQCARAGTVHMGGTLEEIAAWESRYTGRPFVLLVQPTGFDSTRAPAGKHTAWGYCHVPNGSTLDMADAIEAQIERFAPGFRGRILARSVLPPAALEQRNPNLVGGDFNGGSIDLGQFFLRPTRRLYRTPLKGVYLCSSSTPPGGGVHGMCGYYAARLAESAGYSPTVSATLVSK
jgi:phytoene dehydrogenase-like protein